MTLELLFLGTGAAFTVGDDNFQSNLLLTLEHKTLLIDAGGDLRHALYEQKMTHQDINSVYISHLHHDHIGGLEWLAISTKFAPTAREKLELIISEDIRYDLWHHALKGGLSTLKNEVAKLESFFNVNLVTLTHQFKWQTITFELVKTIHVYNDRELMPCYGLFFNYNNTNIYFTSDTAFSPVHLNHYYQKADIIFHDCETTSMKTSVHAHFTELVTLPIDIKQKMWLYHYNPGSLPDAQKAGFLGFVTKGQKFLF
jgi:ribonuclease BN (tRNA processing enzyme)